MKCLILFSGKNKKKIVNLSSAEYAQEVVKIKLLGKCSRKSTYTRVSPDKMLFSTKSSVDIFLISL